MDKACDNCGTERQVAKGLSCDMFCGEIVEGQESLWSSSAHEDLNKIYIKAGKAQNEEFKHKKISEAPVCKCGMDMIASKRPTGIKWVCSGIYCYKSFFEVAE